MSEPGAIYALDAYAQSKMLDHSAWHGFLPRGITASDIDVTFGDAIKPIGVVFDDKRGGGIIAAEFSRNCSSWKELQRGQLWAYQGFLRDGAHCAVLCQHAVDTDRAICSRNDVRRFQLMLFDAGEFLYSPTIVGASWSEFVLKWYERGARCQRRRLLGHLFGGAA